VNRADLNQLSELRVREAMALFAKRYYDGACYLAGFSVECALKACIARKTAKHSFPDRDAVLKSWTHNLKSLAEVAGLYGEIMDEVQGGTTLVDRI
jgi:HEPN domain-containing protein